jgi:hypothetical protein
MNKLLQFRCPKCGRLLFKWREGSNALEYIAPGLSFSVDGKSVTCTKCQTQLTVKNGYLSEQKEKVSVEA